MQAHVSQLLVLKEAAGMFASDNAGLQSPDREQISLGRAPHPEVGWEGEHDRDKDEDTDMRSMETSLP